MIVYDKYALKLAAGIAWKYRDEAAHPDQTFDLRVEDTSGAVLVGAKVTMKNTGTGISSVTMSNSPAFTTSLLFKSVTTTSL